MKQKYSLFFILILLSVKSFSQNCNSLGCAKNYGSQTVDATVADAFGDPGTCYDGFPFKQAYWQFFYSPSGGDFTQTYTPTSTGDPLDLDYVVFDIGTSGPGSIACPVNTSGFSQLFCDYSGTYNQPTGPGIEGTVTTVAGHFYAVVIYAYNDADPSYTFDIGNPQINGVDLDALNCPGVLPVKLSSFDARVNNCITNLDWVVQTESSFKNYEVQYSTDGRSFNTIGTVPAITGTAANKKYSYTHNDPQQGTIYYRLKMTDLDGRIEYSKTIALKLDCKGSSVLVYPNPVNDFLNVNLTNSEKDQTSASLFDNTGKLVYTGLMKSGSNSIDMSKFAKGIYLLRLKSNSEIKNIKIIK